MGTFPFGCPVMRCAPSADGPCRLFVLGAYPSALHVRWTPPPSSALRTINALAVANEPEPFWNGSDELARIEHWKGERGWIDDWGIVAPPPRLNGSSGVWVDRNVLEPLGIERHDAWVTDCLDTYRTSTRMASAIESVYEPFAKAHRLPSADLAAHPSEAAIVREAKASQLDRLRSELTAARPELVVTLGNAALRALRYLVEAPSPPTKLSSSNYGGRIGASVDGVAFEWLPLAHPAAPKPYQAAHAAWRERAKH